MIAIWLKNDIQKSTSTSLILFERGVALSISLKNMSLQRERSVTRWREDEVKKRSKEKDKDHELRRLKVEVSRLREERDILKKAAAWFAVESVSTLKKGTRS